MKLFNSEIPQTHTEVYVKTLEGNLELIGETEVTNVPKIIEIVSPISIIKEKRKPSLHLELRLKEILAERHMEQKELAELTGLTTRTISELCNNKSKHYPKGALEKIMEALDLHEPNDLFVIK